jgi:phytoene dehydrogenase-like protein
MGAITQAIARECAARGVVVETNAGVERVLVEDGKAAGVRLSDGRELRAKTIVSNVNPKLLYQQLVSRGDLDTDVAERIDRYRCGSGTFRMNVALSELPDFSAAPGTHLQPHHQSGILIGPSLQYFEQAYFDAKSRQYNPGWSRQPIVELVISSTLDDTLAPAGQHVASLFCQHVNPVMPDNGDGGWDAHRDTVARLMIDTVDAYAPNFHASVLGYKALSPLDLEREYGLVGGDIFHGSLGLDQLFSARPLLGQGNYRGALEQLYLCGAGTHPGGGVTGLPGRNAAREILRDLRRKPRPD